MPETRLAGKHRLFLWFMILGLFLLCLNLLNAAPVRIPAFSIRITDPYIVGGILFKSLYDITGLVLSDLFVLCIPFGK